MAFEMEVPEDLGNSGGNFLRKPGTYHCTVTQVYEGLAPKSKSGEQKIIDGFSVVLDVLEGTVKTELGKVANVTFFNGKLTSKDQGRFARLKQSSFLVATNVIQPSQRGQKVQVDLEKAVNQQLIVTFEEDPESTNDAGEHYLRIAGASTYHVDDPRCAGIPKHAGSIALIPKQFRHDANWFDQLKTSQDSKTSASSQQREPAGAGAGSSSQAKSNVSFDDL